MIKLNKYLQPTMSKTIQKWPKGMKKKCNFHCPILIVTHVYSSPDTALKFKKLAEKNSWERDPNDMMTGGFCFCSHHFSYLARLCHRWGA